MFFNKKKNILCVEISPWSVNIIEGFRSSKQIKIINFKHISEIPETKELLVKKIIDEIGDMGTKTKVIHLVIYDPRFEAEFMSVPNVSKQEAGTLVKRQVKKKLETLFPDPANKKDIAAVNAKRAAYCYTDYQMMGKKGILYGLAPRVMIDETIRLLEKAEFQPMLITSYPLALNNILLFMEQDHQKESKKEGDEEEKEFASFLYLSTHQVWLIIADRHGEYFFSRDLLSIKSNESKIAMEVQEDVLVKQIDLVHDPICYQNVLMEVVRSFLYINQQTKGIISSMTVGSSQDLPENLVKDLNEKLQIPVNVFDPSTKVSLGGESAEDVKLNFLPVILGLFADSAHLLNINFIPLKIRERKKQAAGSFILTLFLILYCVAFAFGYIGLNWAQENYRRAVQAQEESIKSLQPAYDLSKKNETDRLKYEFHKSILPRFEHIEPLWRGIFYELSLFSSPNMSFSLISIGKNDPKKEEGKKKKKKKGEEEEEKPVILLSFNAMGSIYARDSGDAQKALDEFIAKLNKSVYFRNPKVINISLAPNKEGPADNSVALTFTLACNIAR